MKTLLTFVTLVLGLQFCAMAQSKKDLLTRIDELKSELSVASAELVESKKNERVCATKLETTESQMATLRETNNSILSKMGSFTQLSQKKSDNLEKSLQAIKKKDAQLNTINDALSKADSLKLATFSSFKNAVSGVGEKEAKLNLTNDGVVIDISNDFLFQSTNSANITENSKTLLLSKIAAVLKAKQDLTFQVEGNSNESSFKNNTIDNWDLSSLQSAAIIRTLQMEYGIDPTRMVVVGKSQYSTQIVETKSTIKISPKYDVFFETVKESMKD